jgi:transcriptional regulator, PadR family
MTPQQRADNTTSDGLQHGAQSEHPDATAKTRHHDNQTATRSDETASEVRFLPDQDVELFYRHAQRKYALADSFTLDDDMVKNNLDDLLLALVAHREAETNGKELRRDLATLFNSHLSPGTVYPSLHDLDESDLLDIHELVQTKEYDIADTESVVEQLERAMRQHLVLGDLLRQAVAEINEQATQTDESDGVDIPSLR